MHFYKEIKTNINNMKLKSLFAAGAILSLASIASAQDKATLDLLVSKGLITAEDAAGVAKSSAVVVNAKDKAVKKVTLTGRIQAQYMASETSWDSTSKTENGFYLRRIYLGMAADLGAGWKGSVVVNFADGAALDSATISKKVESLNGTLSVGYQKVNFGYEENTSSSALMTVERSTATRYFNEGASSSKALGFGAKHTGIFWKGDIDAIEGLSYSASLVNSNQGVSDTTDFSYWASVAYAKKFDSVSFKAGLNFGYTSQFEYNTDSTMLGINPYIAANIAGLDIWGELLYGDVDQTGNSPFGVNIAAEYKFDIGEWGQIAPAIRYSYLDTDGMGVGTNTMKNVDSSNTYDSTQSFYVGVNWYIVGNSVKLSAGYEYAKFYDATNGAGDADVSVFRTQLQLLF